MTLRTVGKKYSCGKSHRIKYRFVVKLEKHKEKALQLKGDGVMKKTKYAGTQTEKNLMAAFAGES